MCACVNLSWAWLLTLVIAALRRLMGTWDYIVPSQPQVCSEPMRMLSRFSTKAGDSVWSPVPSMVGKCQKLLRTDLWPPKELRGARVGA